MTCRAGIYAVAFFADFGGLALLSTESLLMSVALGYSFLTVDVISGRLLSCITFS